MTASASIRRVRALDTRLQQKRWLWAEENEAAIASFWRDALRKKPKMFNGRVLMIGAYEDAANSAAATYFETDFASFLAWIDGGFPDRSVANGFAAAALRTADGAYICGVMGAHTANAGKIYFPGGTPDRNDICPDGRVDFLASVTRELEEETGLSARDVVMDDGWIVVQVWPLIAYVKLIDIALPADKALEKLNANLARQSEPELAGFHVVRSAADIDDEKMPSYLKAYFREIF